MAEAVLIVTAKGFGKVVDETEFPTKGRGGRGVTGFKVTEDSGPVAAIEHVKTGKGQRVLVITAGGQALMTSVDEISTRSRSAGGVKVMNVADDDAVVAVLI
ncbi:MAG: DNA gyrase C-terminal beta-propeller domain-containing protein [Armatimonadota bacterium]